MSSRLTIRFLRGWQGREAGQTDSLLGSGIQKTLVENGIAEFVQLGKRRAKKTRKNVQRDNTANG